ncbi:MAG: SCO family protein [Myxococcaceae bacterium]
MRKGLMTLLLASAAFAAEPLDTHSVYQLDAKWTDARGKKVELASLAGHPVVLAMVYTSCQMSCPLTIDQMKRIEAKLDPKARAQARFVLVSFDPARDTPKRLAEVARERRLTGSNWVLLSGSDDSVRELAAVIGFKFERLESGDFTHSNILTVLDAGGVIKTQVSGTDADIVAAAHAVQ